MKLNLDVIEGLKGWQPELIINDHPSKQFSSSRVLGPGLFEARANHLPSESCRSLTRNSLLEEQSTLPNNTTLAQVRAVQWMLLREQGYPGANGKDEQEVQHGV